MPLTLLTHIITIKFIQVTSCPALVDPSSPASTSNFDMLLAIPELLNSSQLTLARQLLYKADWVDGRVTAGHQSARAKDNMQLSEGHPAAIQLGEMIMEALGSNALFISAALPSKVFPPLFNRYEGVQAFRMHVD